VAAAAATKRMGMKAENARLMEHKLRTFVENVVKRAAFFHVRHMNFPWNFYMDSFEDVG
jgi:hypothetical protein